MSLVARAGIISEAKAAWQGKPVAIGRGLQNGLHHAVGLFLIDLLWFLPILLFNLLIIVGIHKMIVYLIVEYVGICWS